MTPSILPNIELDEHIHNILEEQHCPTSATARLSKSLAQDRDPPFGSARAFRLSIDVVMRDGTIARASISLSSFHATHPRNTTTNLALSSPWELGLAIGRRTRRPGPALIPEPL